MKLSLRFLSVVWRVFNWTFPNYCYGTSMNLKKEGNKENNTKKQNKIAIIGYEKYSTSALRERWLTSSQCIGRTAQGKQNGFPLGTSYERWKYRQARWPLLKNKKRSRTTITIKIIDNWKKSLGNFENPPKALNREKLYKKNKKKRIWCAATLDRNFMIRNRQPSVSKIFSSLEISTICPRNTKIK